MANPQGTPIWYELMAADPDAAARFYGEVIGWTAGAPPGGVEADYRVLSAGSEGVGGIMRAPEGMDTTWLVYFGVDDVDATVAKATGLGATVHMPPTDIPGIGRFAFLADPQGTRFYVMRGASPEDSRAFSPSTEGHAAWNELVTGDQAAGMAFYRDLLGHTHAGGMPMGEGQEYSFLTLGDVPVGAAMTLRSGKPRWFIYFRVGDLDAAIERLKAAGGTLRSGPNEVPGGDWVGEATDPQGAVFGLIGRHGEKAA